MRCDATPTQNTCKHWELTLMGLPSDRLLFRAVLLPSSSPTAGVAVAAGIDGLLSSNTPSETSKDRF